MCCFIWMPCGGKPDRQMNKSELESQIHPLVCKPWRMVECQEQIATTQLVDSQSEQHLLEELLEVSKPKPGKSAPRMNYLLTTPFRYPPLRHGSRFGPRTSPSLFYGSLKRRTALCETAYYRFVFWDGMAEPPPNPVLTEHSMFQVMVKTGFGLDLSQQSFNQPAITDPVNYTASQALGEQMRNLGVEAFLYSSARDIANLNAGLFTPTAFGKNRPLAKNNWRCRTMANRVEFSNKRFNYRFDREKFMVDGQFPSPAV